MSDVAGVPQVSFVIPVKNERSALPGLIKEIIDLQLPSFEVVVVDDGSTDRPDEILSAFAGQGIRLIRHAVCSGQSAAIRSGVQAALAPVIVTLDGDGQNDPADAPQLLQILNSNGAAMVAGQRITRQDNALKILSSRFANAVRQYLLQDGIRDTGCSLKVFRRESFLNLPFFDHMHRYLPALIKRDGGVVLTADVRHRVRAGGRSNYGTWDRLAAALSDLPGVLWLCRRRRLPGAVVEIALDGSADYRG